MSLLVILGLWKAETMIIRNRTLQAGNTKETPPPSPKKKKEKKEKPKPIFIISEEGLQRARETRGIFCIMENHCFSYASFV